MLCTAHKGLLERRVRFTTLMQVIDCYGLRPEVGKRCTGTQPAQKMAAAEHATAVPAAPGAPACRPRAAVSAPLPRSAPPMTSTAPPPAQVRMAETFHLTMKACNCQLTLLTCSAGVPHLAVP